MGRSVSYPQGAIVAFRLIESGARGDLDWQYECLVEDVVSTARQAFPSLLPHDGWRGREDRILLRNAYADCGISIYCGLAAVWLVERNDSCYWEAELSDGLTKCPATSCRCSGRFVRSGASPMARAYSSGSMYHREGHEIGRQPKTSCSCRPR